MIVEGNPLKGDNPLGEERKTRRLILACIVLGAFAILLSFLSLDVIVFVALYADIFILALCIFFLFNSKVPERIGPSIKVRNNDMGERRRPRHSRNRIDSLSVYMKYAAGGSEFSRREIALAIRRIFVQKFGNVPRDSLDKSFLEDLKIGVFPYVPDSLFQAEESSSSSQEQISPSPSPEATIAQEEARKEKKDDARQYYLGNQAYLATITRIVWYMESH